MQQKVVQVMGEVHGEGKPQTLDACCGHEPDRGTPNSDSAQSNPTNAPNRSSAFRFMESPDAIFSAHWDHEPVGTDSTPSLIFSAQGGTSQIRDGVESVPTRFMGSLIGKGPV